MKIQKEYRLVSFLIMACLSCTPKALDTDSDIETGDSTESATEYNAYYNIVVLSPNNNWLSVAVGTYHSCGLKTNNTIECWGCEASGDHKYSEYDIGGEQCDPPEGTYIHLATSRDRVGCAIDEDNDIDCWGSDWASTWSEVSADELKLPPTQVSVSQSDFCYIYNDDTVGCWGDDLPTAYEKERFSNIDGNSSVCGVSFDGNLKCWETEPDYITTATSDAENIKDVSIGNHHICTVSQVGELACWGDDAFIESGETTPPSGSFTHVSSAYNYNCALTDEGSIECWGGNHTGQTDAPEGVFTDIQTENSHACAVREDGHIVCWGSNRYGALNIP